MTGGNVHYGRPPVVGAFLSEGRVHRGAGEATPCRGLQGTKWAQLPRPSLRPGAQRVVNVAQCKGNALCGISVTGSRNRIENNLVTGSPIGIRVTGIGNTVFRNTTHGNTTAPLGPYRVVIEGAAGRSMQCCRPATHFATRESTSRSRTGNRPKHKGSPRARNRVAFGLVALRGIEPRSGG